MPVQPRYAFLDGIRGIAAVFVILRHVTAWGVEAPHGYMAVDLFFILSGFVIAHAYDDRLAGGALSPGRFLLVRLIRLYPMLLLSLAVCLVHYVVVALAQGGGGLPDPRDFAASLLLTGVYVPSRLPGTTFLFPLNSPCWSLFFELVVNVVYAVSRRLLGRRALAGVVAASGAGLVAVAVWNGHMDFGSTWGLRSLGTGLVRAGFGFSAGLLLHRHRAVLARLRGVSPWLAVGAVALVLAAPGLGRLDLALDLLAALVIFPLVVAVGSLAGPSRVDRGLLALGEASYAVYVLHVPIARRLPDVLHLAIQRSAPWGALGFAGVLTAVAVVLERRVDAPLRRWLSGRLLRRRPHGWRLPAGDGDAA